MPRPKKEKVTPPRHVFTRALSDFEFPTMDFEDNMSQDAFMKLLGNCREALLEAQSRLLPEEKLRVGPIVAGYDGGILGFHFTADRTETDEEYAARLESYRKRESTKEVGRRAAVDARIARLEAQLAELKGLQKGENDV